jgi:hypothetical protein
VVDMIINSLMYCTHYPSTCNFVVGLEAHDGAHEQPSLHCMPRHAMARFGCPAFAALSPSVSCTRRCDAQRASHQGEPASQPLAPLLAQQRSRGNRVCCISYYPSEVKWSSPL